MDYDDIINEFDRSCSCSNLSDTTFGVASECSAKDIGGKLMVHLDEKIKQLEATKEDNKKLLMVICDKLRADQSKAMVEMANILTMAETKQKEYQDMNATLRMTLWKSFPSSHLCYYIKMPAFGYLYVDNNGYLRTSDDPQQQPFPCAGYFKFIKHSDGTYSIYSMLKEKFLQKHPSSKLSSFVHFSAKEKDCDTVDTKFVLFFHTQHQQQGFMVDIRSLALYSYLTMSKQGDGNIIEATSRTTPDNKFLIIPVLDGQ